jgi:ribosomal protein S18 acetylase RimI-like enzyme
MKNSSKESIKLIDVDTENAHIIYEFIKNCDKSLKHFRYFEKRKPEECIRFHESTIILQCDKVFVGYAHLDKENDKTWLGICIADDWVGRGFGKILMKEILNRAKTNPITLSVDSDNLAAINLYKKFGFLKKKHINNNIILMENHDTNL